MVTLIPQRARLHDLLSLRAAIESAREDLVYAQHQLADMGRRHHQVGLHLGTAVATFESIVSIYNRLVVEYEPQDRRRP